MAEASAAWQMKQEVQSNEEEENDAGGATLQAAASHGTGSGTAVAIKHETIECAGEPTGWVGEAPRKKYQHAKQHGLSDYNKKQIFKKWQESNFSQEGFEQAVKTFKVDLDDAKAFFQQQIDDAQAHVHEEVDSKHFRNANQWLKRLEELNLVKDSNNESATIFDAMARLRDLPKPEEMSGVCLGTCYQFIANAALGKPPPEMNAVTTAFLLNHYKAMQKTCEGEAASEAISAMAAKLQNAYTPDPENKVKRSLDPFSLDETL